MFVSFFQDPDVDTQQLLLLVVQLCDLCMLWIASMTPVFVAGKTSATAGKVVEYVV